MRNLLTWLLYGNTGHPVDPSTGRIDPTRLDAAARLMKSLADTIGGLLRVAQEQAMNVPSLQPGAFRDELRKIAKRYQGPLSAHEEEGLRKQSANLITSQRQQEAEYIRGREQELREIIGLIGEELHTAAQESDSFTTQMQAELTDLGRVVEIQDLRQVRERIQQHVGAIVHHLESKRSGERERIRSLEEQVGVLTHKVEITPQVSQTDPLTMLYSKEAFDKQVRVEVSLANRLHRPLSLVLIDVDHLQLANDTYGREATDELLVRLSGRIIREFFRKTDFIARWGGDEFAVLLTQEQMDVARRAAEGLCAGLTHRAIQTRAGEVVATVSAGVTQYQPGETVEDLLARAWEGLAQAKRDGGNRVVVTAAPEARKRAA